MATCDHLWGIVVNDLGGAPLKDVLVRAVVRSRRVERELDAATTDASGHFSVDLSDLDVDRIDRFVLRFYVNGDERDVVGANNRWRKAPPNGCTFRLAPRQSCITGPVAPDNQEPLVYGSVTNGATGKVVPDSVVEVHLFEKVFAAVPAQLGTAAAVTGGEYSVGYTGAPRDVFVRLVRTSDQAVLHTSEIVPRASGKTKINIEFCHDDFPGDTEYDQVYAAIDPLLSGVTLANLDPDDIALLCVRGSQALERVVAFVLARRMQNTTLMQATPQVTDGEEVLYGLLRQGFPANLGRLLRHSLPRLKAGIESAADENIIASTIGSDAQTRAEQLKAKAVARSKEATTPGSLYNILLILLVTTDADSFVDTLSEHTGTAAEFWSAWSITGSYTPNPTPTIDDVKRLIKLARLCLSHKPLVEELWNNHSQPEVEDLASWGKSTGTPNWTTVVQSVSPTYPDVITGSSSAEKEANYIEYLYREAQVANAGVAVTRKWAKSTGADWEVYLYNNPDFNFETADIDGLGLHSDVATPLKTKQRLFRITPTSADMTAVIASMESAGYDSARSIAGGGRKRFMENILASIGDDVDLADVLYARARRASSMASSLYGSVHPRLLGPDIAYVGGSVDPTSYDASIPAYSRLFGGTDACECRHCLSVYGPAAYFADLLHWLDERDALLELTTRRPDLLSLVLDCDNALVGLPYVDLAIEVMEAAVLSAEASSAPTLDTLIPIQTTAETPALLAKPEHVLKADDAGVDRDAYYFLKLATYPRSLPYDHHLELARAYLRHFDIPVFKVWEDVSTATAPSAAEVAAEAAGLSASMRTTLSTTDANVGQLYAADGVMPAELSPVSGTTVQIKTFMDNQQVKYEELLDLAHTRFANTSGELAVVAATGTSGCTFDDVVFSATPPTNTSYLRAAVFLRLWQTVPWSMLDLDVALNALGATGPNLSDANVTDLGNLARLEQRTKLSLPELCAWFADLDTYRDRERNDKVKPIYDRLFLDASAFEADEMEPYDVHGSGYPSPAEPVTDHEEYIRAAIGMSAVDFDEAVDALGGTDLNLANLSALYRWSSLARHTRLSVREIRDFSTLSGYNPFNSPSDARSFLEELGHLRASGFTVDGAMYLCAHDAVAVDRMAPSNSWLQELLGNLRDELRGVEDKLEEAATASSEDCEAAVARWAVDATETDSLMEIIDLESTALPADQKTTWGASGLAKVISDEDAYTYLINDDSSNSSYIGDLLDRYVWVINRILGHESATKPQDAVIEVLAEAFGVKTTVMDALRSWNFTAWTESDYADVFIRDAFLSDANEVEGDPWGDITTTNLGDYFTAAEILYKAGLILSRVDVTADELDWWREDNLQFDLTGLSTTEETVATTIATNYTGFRNTIRVFAMRQRFPGSEPDFVSLMENITGGTGTTATFATDLAERTGWDEAELNALIAGLQLTVPLLGEPDNLHKLADVHGYMRRLGVSYATLATWSTTSLTSVESANAVRAARGQYEDLQKWSAVSRPVRNAVREKQRGALATFLIANNAGFSDEDDLYAHYLIDVEMDPCMVTSRLKQAISSAQLFVHRAFMGLESVTLNREDYEEWEWRQRYRLWEAARKVFLYPENWIEPELRSDTSPFFDELVDELLQNDINDELVSEAMLRYLDKLNSVSRLAVVGSYHQTAYDDTGEVITDVLHVFARTYAEPRKMYYRRLDTQLTWSAWEDVPLNIKSDHVVPVIIGERLVLFWLQFEQAGEPAEDENDTESYEYWEITLNWSEYRRGQWGDMMTSRHTLQTGKRSEKRLFHMNYWVEENQLTMSVERDDYSIQDAALQKSEQIGRFIVDFCTFDVSEEQETVYSKKTYEFPIPVITGYKNEKKMKRPIWGWGTFSVTTGSDTGPMMYTTIAPYKTRAFGNRFQCRVDTMGLDVAETNYGWYEDTAIETVILLETVTKRETYVSASRQYNQFVGQIPFFVQDSSHAWFVTLETCEERDTLVSDDPSALLQSCDEVVSFNASSDQGASSWLQPAFPIADPELTGAALKNVNNTLTKFGFDSQDSLLDETHAGYRFWAFDHPYACRFLKEVRLNGVMGLLRPDVDEYESDGVTPTLLRQGLTDSYFSSYDPTDYVHPTVPVDEIDFSTRGAYSLYNWEIFFHIPFFIACQLSAQQKFGDAQRWFHTIFDPTNKSTHVAAPQKYWMVAPLMQESDTAVTNWAAFTGSASSDQAEEFEAQVAAWEADPFDPHVVARMRPAAYARAVVIKYIENLLGWGDHLFRQDTIETVNQAAQLYILAGQILGDRPVTFEAREEPTYKSYNDIRTDLDTLSNTLTELENTTFTPRTFASRRIGSGSSGLTAGIRTGNTTPAVGGMPYFCVPQNGELVKYWDTVEDRLFKIRNCMNIEGVVRVLPLFEPPLDPGAIVRAVAGGASLGTVVADVTGQRPPYRFTTVVAKAQAFSGTVRALGGALLSALEKGDAEALAQLRASHEVQVLEATGDVRALQVEEAQHSLRAARQSLRSAEQRKKYYLDLIDTGLIPQEKLQQAMADNAQVFSDIGGTLAGLSGIVGAFPDTTIGIAAGVTAGGESFWRALQGATQAAHTTAGRLRFESERAARAAQNKRREQEWKQQLKLAERDISQIESQIEAAETRLKIAKKEKQNHALQLRNAETVATWMTTKYTNRKLYSWMVTQISKVYFQSYQLAYEMAKAAEKSYQFELGSEASFILYGHYDSLRKGLLAGERLTHDLERLEASYLKNNTREYELTKHISLDRLDPMALARLRAEGECWFDLPEALFDLDCPGHYFRRISGLSVTIACVGGSHAQVNADLTLSNSSVRTSPDADSAALVADAATSETIITSTGIGDSGLFSGDSSDGRYLPFERAGVISTWRLRFCNDKLKQIDWDSVSDVVLHMRYTARDGGEAFRESVKTALPDALNVMSGGYTDEGSTSTGTGHFRVVSAKRDAPDAWYQAQNGGSLELAYGDDAKPYFAVGRTVTLTGLHVLVVPGAATMSQISVDVVTAALSLAEWPTATSTALVHAEAPDTSATDPHLTSTAWPDTVTLSNPQTATFAQSEDVLVVLEYTVS